MKLVLALLFFSTTSYAVEQCKIRYDDFRIARLETSADDYYYCFGLLHGKDRAWQMDYFRRAAYGTNAELYGYSHIKADMMMRLLDLKSKAEELWRDFPEDKKLLLESYAQGVNEGFEGGKEQKEIKDIGHTLDPWTPVDSIVVLLLQSFDQTRKTFYKDYEEGRHLEVWGEKAARLFDEDGLPWESTILHDGEYPKKAQTVTLKNHNYRSPAPKLLYPIPDFFGKENGSNNWVVASEKSETGNALFANDPHLDLKTPIFWYWLQVKSPNKKLIGASLPGAPVVISGTNGKVAWGLTNSYIKTASTFFLKEEETEKLEKVRPVVWFKVGFLQIPFFFKTFFKAGKYPILPLEIKDKRQMIMRWSGYDITPEHIASMFYVNDAKNVKEADEAFGRVGLPSWNFVFADTKGKIGYRVVGLVEKHTEKYPYGISEKSIDEVKSVEYLTPKEVPNLMNPKRGYISTGNHKHWPDDAKFYGGRGYSYSFRGLRMDEMLKKNKQDIESMKQIICDTYVTDAKFFLPKLMPIIQESDLRAEIIELEKWDLIARDDSYATGLYRRTMDLAMENLEVNEAAFIRLLDEINDEQKEIIIDSFNTAVSEVKQRDWGDVHRLDFSHLSATKRWQFSPDIAGPGDNHTVNPGTATWDRASQTYRHTNGASMRLLIEMKEKPEIYLALPGVNQNYQEGEMSFFKEWKECSFRKINL